jgi:hypothetical protein
MRIGFKVPDTIAQIPYIPAMRIHLIALTVVLAGSLSSAQEPTLEQVMERVGKYVASYGEKAAVVVASEKYSQSVLIDGADMGRPRELKSEFAIVRVAGGGWTGYRDVIESEGKPVQDRKDRLVSLVTNIQGDASELIRIANESARFNIGPISRNFNVPTAAMFFFVPSEHARFTFTRKGAKKVDGIDTWEIEFRETKRPTLIMTRAGKDVPIEGTLHVKPDDGTVVRTRFKMRNFADVDASPEQQAPQQRPPTNPSGQSGIVAPIRPVETIKMESEADIEVTFAKPAGLDFWFPASMVELYQGPIKVKVTPVMARATTRAKYSDFRQFATSIKIAQ